MDTDRKLAARAGAGDERAFAELVERHRKPLLRYVAKRFRPDLAEDAVQEALMSAHRALLSGTVPADVRAWLSTIAWRRALDLARREREALPLDSAVLGSSDHDPEARAIQANELGRVVAAFSELPERQRTALTMSALEGRSLEEIGHELRVAPDAAKSLVARSRRTLTHRLAAAELDCGDARIEMESAALRGVRLGGQATLHVQSCRACARAHRAIRMRRRVAALVPIGLLVRTHGVRERLRDLIAFNPAWEAQIGAAKMCTAACLSIGAGATVAAPTVTVVAPIIARSTPTPAPKAAKLVEKQKHHKKKAKAKPTPIATVIVAKATPTWTATPQPTVTAKKRQSAKSPPTAKQRARMLSAAKYPTGGGESEVTKPLKVVAPTPPPVETPPPSPTATPAG
jgi:RNA polymerase sigma-70 factor (ECF subfamily)